MKEALSLGFAAVALVIFPQVVPGSADGVELPSVIEGEWARVLSEGIRNRNIRLVIARIAPHDLSPLSNGVVPEALESFSAVTTRLSLAPVTPTRALRGEVDRRIFVEHSAVASTGDRPQYPPFRWIPGSVWLLLLVSPLDSDYSGHVGSTEKSAGPDGEAFLSDTSWFEIYERGYGAFCLLLPNEEADSTSLTVAPTGMVADLELLLHEYERAADERTQPDPSLAIALRTRLGRAVFTLLFPSLADSQPALD